MDGYIIHVDGDASPIDKVSKYGVHHHLKSHGQVGEPKKHYCWFKEPFVCYEGHFPPVLFFDEYFVVSPFYVNSCKQCAPSESVDQLGNEGVVVLDSPGIYWLVVLDWS